VRRHGGRAAQRLPFGASRLAGSGPGRGPGNWRADHATGQWSQDAGVARLDSPQLMIERIQQAHALYCRLTDQRVSLRFDRSDFGMNSSRGLPRGRSPKSDPLPARARSVQAAAMSELEALQSPAIDRFEEDLNISRVRLYPPKAHRHRVQKLPPSRFRLPRQAVPEERPSRPPAGLTNPGSLSGGARLVASHARFRNGRPDFPLTRLATPIRTAAHGPA